MDGDQPEGILDRLVQVAENRFAAQERRQPKTSFSPASACCHRNCRISILTCRICTVKAGGKKLPNYSKSGSLRPENLA